MRVFSPSGVFDDLVERRAQHAAAPRWAAECLGSRHHFFSSFFFFLFRSAKSDPSVC